MSRKIISAVLCIVIMCSMGTNVFALSRVDKRFWSIDKNYCEALDAGDLNGIIDYAKQEIDILKKYPLEGQILECLAARTERVALSYEALCDYPNAAYYFGQYAPYAAMLGWDDAVKIAKAKQLQYSPVIELYESTDKPQIDYGAKHEPTVGVYYGLPSDSQYRNNLQNESMVLLYHEFGDTYFDWINVVMSQAQEKGIVVEYALNLPREGNQLDEVLADTTFLPQLVKMFKQYPNVPVLLRFGAEMNIWGAYAEPTKFVKAFQKVSTTLKASLPNIAMVWSPNMVSSWNIEVNDYYPGDNYVDWVGASLYLNRYFLGREWSDDEKFNEVVFFSGDNADPVLALKEIVDKYGDRKPIMISESGAGHYVRTMGLDQTQWAKNRLQQLYTYIPMVYPQVKLISHFDKVISHETNDYSLSSNKEIANEYKKLVSLPTFIQRTDATLCTTYKNLSDKITVEQGENLELFAYAHIYGNNKPKLDFYLDDKWIGSSSDVGYGKKINLASYPVGEYKFLVATDVYSREYTLNIVKSIKLYLDGTKIETDVSPVTINDRTLVPLRVISEKLGADVKWHGDTESIDIYKDGTKIKMAIGSDIVSVDGEESKIDVAPVIIDSRTMVPIRWIAETMLLKVDWNETEQAVYMTKILP